MTFKVNISCRIGCAGWSLPKEMRSRSKELYLSQYSKLFNCVELNSSFHRLHLPSTYKRWSSTVPDDFKFSVKLPKLITHSALLDTSPIRTFFDGALNLEDKFETLLIQFPPKKDFNHAQVRDLLTTIRGIFKRKIVCEPRHSSWFAPSSVKILSDYSVTIVSVDPKPVRDAPELFETREGGYIRLHGTPEIYYLSYSEKFISQLSRLPALRSSNTWIIFDNTALGYAFNNAQSLINKLSSSHHN